jgi:hypothetical protein
MMLRLSACLALILGLSSCNTLRELAKASPAKPSAFLTHGEEMKKPEAKTYPFLRIWRNPSTEVRKKATAKKELYIAPVNLEHLRPMNKFLSRMEIGEQSRQKHAEQLAHYAEEQFIHAFKVAPNPRFQVVDKPTKNALKLELAIVELNPNAISAGITRRAINLVAVPGAESIVGRPLKGHIAIEGKLSDPSQKQSLYEFADAEHNSSALILSVHDYNAYSALRKIIRQWANQFEEVTRTPVGKDVQDSPAFTIWLW